tara:strand:- start:212 stop:424 length:213 start_codon:yes stop_codon:yes gene_type:complete
MSIVVPVARSSICCILEMRIQIIKSESGKYVECRCKKVCIYQNIGREVREGREGRKEGRKEGREEVFKPR